MIISRMGALISFVFITSAASNLTAWGYQDCARDPNNGAFGAAIPRLLSRHLPRHYPPVSRS